MTYAKAVISVTGQDCNWYVVIVYGPAPRAGAVVPSGCVDAVFQLTGELVWLLRQGRAEVP